MDGPPIAGGCVRVEDGRIAKVGTLEDMDWKGEHIREIPDAVIMPGLINSHCHLELGMARGLLPRGEAFPMWVSRLRKSLDGAGPEQYREAARLGALECLKNGTTTVIDVGNTGESLNELADMPIRSFPHIELIGLDPSVAVARVAGALELLAGLPPANERYHPGVTCHAPYSCSPDLLRRVAEATGLRTGPYTLHVAESAEETAMFREGKGALFDFCKRIHPSLRLEKGASPVAFLSRNGLIPRGSLFAHCNNLDAEDVRILAETETSVVHCPRSRAFFNHLGFPLASLRKAGVNLCLGTDSLASNEGLSLFDEMAEFHRAFPEVPCREVLAMATLNGAKALGLEGELGCLRPGAHADFIAIHMRHHPEYDLYEEIVSEVHEVLLVAVGGEEVVS
ncbi:MAG: cytosine/adenosine deaminase-related metal-dependent hydrolase [Fibrobacteres bacterium]|nr:cytosine/adenosine deaminase-related metal-dependent hydrolase [Fibrobacterota bacterium]